VPPTTSPPPGQPCEGGAAYYCTCVSSHCTPKSPTTTTTNPAATVSGWVGVYWGGDTATLDNDELEVSQQASANLFSVVQVGPLKSACSQLDAETLTVQRDPPIPNGYDEPAWKTFLGDNLQAVTDCEPLAANPSSTTDSTNIATDLGNALSAQESLCTLFLNQGVEPSSGCGS
jgi:hypothetical protein